MSLREIAAFRLVSQAPERLVAFYAALGFTIGDAQPIAAEHVAVLALAGGGRRWTMRLGPSVVELDAYDERGTAYPTASTACDLVFQHLAIVVGDAQSAWRAAEAAGARPISRGGPVRLPASTDGVTAVKFRDPEGHPLEFLQFPPGANPHWRGEGMLGVDHSAVSVADAGVSRRFYEAHGLAPEAGSLNTGPTQVALDGLDGVEVEIAPLKPPGRTPPHLELLAYRRPRGRPHPPLAVNDVAATRIVWRSDRRDLLRDPDGHLHELTPA